ncbi:MAG: flagellin, partial [Lachnospiraceae bacterium]|nr:flagellin [Lachnospiraceae bacterium]
MVVQHNMQAANTNRYLNIAVNAQSATTEKLSSGYRINRAADDAAGLSISEKMRAQIRGLNQASTNAENATSLIQTAEGALQEIHSVLQRMSELATQAANDTNVSVDRQAIKMELNQIASEVNRIASTTEFNTMKLLSGTFNNKNLQVGANLGQNIKISIARMSLAGLGLGKDINGTPGMKAKDKAGKDLWTVATKNGGKWVDQNGKESKEKWAKDLKDYTFNDPLSVSNYAVATQTICNIHNAISIVSSQRSKLGALQNRLDHTIKNLDNIAENLQDAESGIRDTDM